MRLKKKKKKVAALDCLRKAFFVVVHHSFINFRSRKRKTETWPPSSPAAIVDPSVDASSFPRARLGVLLVRGKNVVPYFLFERKNKRQHRKMEVLKKKSIKKSGTIHSKKKLFFHEVT